MQIQELLKKMREAGASDLILKVKAPPTVRIEGELCLLEGYDRLTPEGTAKLAFQLLNTEERNTFIQKRELDMAYEEEGLGRFRVNCFMQRGTLAVVLRAIPAEIPSLQELGLPEQCRDLALRPRGLILVTGPAGCGKSTTQAAMLDYRNTHEACHITTVEDPIEFLHANKQAVVDQRQLGRDTHSFANALKYVLRQDPDVILVGEMRDLETIALAITAAETGHLVIGTLHTINAIQTIDRIIDVFPLHQQQQIRMQLASNILGIVSQMLVRKAAGDRRIAAFELLMAIGSVKSLIREAKTYQLPSVMQTGSGQGMRSMNTSLAELVREGLVTREMALERSQDPENLKETLGGGRPEGGKPPGGKPRSGGRK